MDQSSLVSGFYEFSPKERLQLVKELAGLSNEEYERVRKRQHTRFLQVQAFLSGVTAFLLSICITYVKFIKSI
jgi:hypothetical protein